MPDIPYKTRSAARPGLAFTAILILSYPAAFPAGKSKIR
jgi:hypothetical protein